MQILAIDPGNTESGWCVINAYTRKPVTGDWTVEQFGKTENRALHAGIFSDDPFIVDFDVAAIEMVASYGMSVGADVFETCVWIGRFYDAILRRSGTEPWLVKRMPIKKHHCHSQKANDTNIRQALVDRFAYGQPNHGKGTKAEPGWFYGFKADVWQAYALAVYVADTIDPGVVDVSTKAFMA